MSSLFKNPNHVLTVEGSSSIQLTVPWLNLKSNKIKLPQMIFFLKKLLITFLCTY